MAQSIQLTGSKKDLVILVDENILPEHRQGLANAGWQVRSIERIRNPQSEKGAYNEWNYSKFRLWQLTEYSKVKPSLSAFLFQSYRWLALCQRTPIFIGKFCRWWVQIPQKLHCDPNLGGSQLYSYCKLHMKDMLCVQSLSSF